jgi:NAD+ diphosphatase
MEKDSQMTFVSSFKPPEETPEHALWFLFHDQRLLVKDEGSRLLIPESSDLKQLDLVPIRKQFLGRMDDRPCYAGELEDEKGILGTFSFMGLRSLFTRFEEDTIQAAGLANQLVLWNRNHHYCGRCGGLTETKPDERARVCPQCGVINYPRLSPAVIVAVLKDHQILLAHSQRFPTKFYSVLAGFVEPGETLEACVKREVLEEVGITVKNIRYFGSQPWPFPDSLMVGFTAEYGDGNIRIDPSEITDAGWFSPDQLPPIPPKISIARRLIDWFLQQEQGRSLGE